MVTITKKYLEPPHTYRYNIGIHKNKWTKDSFLFLLPAFSLITLIFIYPTIYSLYISFFQYNLISVNVKRIFVGFNNYLKVFSDPIFYNSLFITLRFSFIATFVELIFGFGLALLFQRDYSNKVINFSKIFFLIPMLITPVVVGILGRFMFNSQIGIINIFLHRDINWLGSTQLSFYSCLIMDIWEWTPFMFLIIYAGLKSMPVEPFEAAVIDGASKIAIFRYITLPLMRRIVLIVITLRFLEVMKLYDIVFIATKGGPALSTDTLTLFLHRVGLMFFHIGYAGAISFVFLIITLSVALFLLKTAKFKI